MRVPSFVPAGAHRRRARPRAAVRRRDMASRALATLRLSLPPPVVWAVFGLLWLGGTVAGLTSLMAYDNRPGIAANAPARCPVDSRIARATARPTPPTP